MMHEFILIIVTHVYGGNVVTLQTFNAENTCEYARTVLAKTGVENTICLVK